MGPSPKHRDRSCGPPKEVRSAGVCRQPEGGKSCSQVSHGELTPKSTVLKATVAQIPGQPRDLRMALGEDSRLSPLTQTPTFPLEAGRVSRGSSGERGPWDLLGHPCDGEGCVSFLGVAGTPSVSQLARLQGWGLSPPGSGLGAVTSWVPPPSPGRRNEAGGNLK